MKTIVTIELPSGKKLELDKRDLAHLRKELTALDNEELQKQINRWRELAERRLEPEPRYVPVPYPIQPIPVHPWGWEITCQTGDGRNFR